MSFAGADRVEARRIITQLNEIRPPAFYDEWEEHALVGEALLDSLHAVYSVNAFVVIIIYSWHYLNRPYTLFELEAINDRAAAGQRDTILVVTTDRADLHHELMGVRTISFSAGLEAIVAAAREMLPPDIDQNLVWDSPPRRSTGLLAKQRNRIDEYETDVMLVADCEDENVVDALRRQLAGVRVIAGPDSLSGYVRAIMGWHSQTRLVVIVAPRHAATHRWYWIESLWILDLLREGRDVLPFLLKGRALRPGIEHIGHHRSGETEGDTISNFATYLRRRLAAPVPARDRTGLLVTIRFQCAAHLGLMVILVGGVGVEIWTRICAGWWISTFIVYTIRENFEWTRNPRI